MPQFRIVSQVIVFWLFAFATASAWTDRDATNKPTPGAGSPHIPFAFVENRGQANPRVRYIGSGPEFKAWFEDRGVTLQRGQSGLRIAFEQGALSTPPDSIRPGDPMGATANYIRGRDSGSWQTGLPLYGSIRYSGVWPGVELTYRAERSRLVAEYLVGPGAAVDRILVRFGGNASIQVDGSLRVTTSSGEFTETRPVLYQLIQGERKEVGGGFRRLPNGLIGYWTSDYDHAQPLVIDPSILFSGYFGGNTQESITAVAIDGLNNVIVAGWTSSTDLPASNGARTQSGGGVDAFVAGFLPNGGGLIYCTYLGGSGDDRAFGLSLDSSRNVYVTGWTSSANFPVAGAFQPHLKGTRDAFVTKLNAAGNALVYSTYLGGSGVDVGYAIAVGPDNSAVIVGDTTSTNLPVSLGAFQLKSGGGQDAFVAKLPPAGTPVAYLTYLGGSGLDHASSVLVGASGGITLGGYTWSNNFPTVKPLQSRSGGGQDGFVTRLTPALQMLTSTYLGGSGADEVTSVAKDAIGNVYAAGTTSSANFPVTPGAFQTTFGGQTDGFIARFILNGPLQATFLGGASSDSINAIALDFHANPYVTGSTSSPDFPVQRPLQTTNAGAMDAFVAKLNMTLSAVTFGTYLGGSGSDAGNAIAVDSQTSIVVAGQTSSQDLPVAGSLQNYLPAVLSSFVTKIAPNFMLGVAYAFQGQMEFTADPWHVASYTSSTAYGTATDLPIVGDWTGSGTKRIGIFRNGTWFLDTNGNGVLDGLDKTVVFGQAGDIPVVGDWRGTGQVALGLFRSGTFILDLSGHLSGVPTGLSDATFTFGQGGDIPIVADWNGSGTAKVGVFRNGLWIVDYAGARALNGSNRSYVYGQAGDRPVVGDWDSSRNPPKIGIYRNGLWVLDYDGDNVWTVPGLNEMSLSFGFAGYTPLLF